MTEFNPFVISRKEALDRGLLRYFTGKSCENGHISERYTKNSACIKCLREHNLKKGAAYSKKWYQKKVRLAKLAQATDV